MYTELKARTLWSCACILGLNDERCVPWGQETLCSTESREHFHQKTRGQYVRGPRVAHLLGSQLLADEGWDLEAASFCLQLWELLKARWPWVQHQHLELWALCSVAVEVTRGL